MQSKMQSYCSCKPGKMILDLRGKLAAQVQKDLRSQLVQDLKDGNDEAAFVCKQLGIDSVPRADQLELMIAAMPGVEKIVFEGPAMKSFLTRNASSGLCQVHPDVRPLNMVDQADS